jgi:hypothetical protein
MEKEAKQKERAAAKLEKQRQRREKASKNMVSIDLLKSAENKLALYKESIANLIVPFIRQYLARCNIPMPESRIPPGAATMNHVFDGVYVMQLVEAVLHVSAQNSSWKLNTHLIVIILEALLNRATIDFFYESLKKTIDDRLANSTAPSTIVSVAATAVGSAAPSAAKSAASPMIKSAASPMVTSASASSSQPMDVKPMDAKHVETPSAPNKDTAPSFVAPSRPVSPMVSMAPAASNVSATPALNPTIPDPVIDLSNSQSQATPSAFGSGSQLVDTQMDLHLDLSQTQPSVSSAAIMAAKVVDRKHDLQRVQRYLDEVHEADMTSVGQKDHYLRFGGIPIPMPSISVGGGVVYVLSYTCDEGKTWQELNDQPLVPTFCQPQKTFELPTDARVHKCRLIARPCSTSPSDTVDDIVPSVSVAVRCRSPKAASSITDQKKPEAQKDTDTPAQDNIATQQTSSQAMDDLSQVTHGKPKRARKSGVRKSKRSTKTKAKYEVVDKNGEALDENAEVDVNSSEVQDAVCGPVVVTTFTIGSLGEERPPSASQTY